MWLGLAEGNQRKDAAVGAELDKKRGKGQDAREARRGAVMYESRRGRTRKRSVEGNGGEGGRVGGICWKTCRKVKTRSE